MRETASLRNVPWSVYPRALPPERKTGRCPIIISIEATLTVRVSMESAGSSPVLILPDITAVSVPVPTDRETGTIITDPEGRKRMSQLQ